jgi:signal transduction histidine kinase
MNLAFWVLVLATVELLPVPVSRVLQLSLGFPIRLGIAILYPPFVAAGVALLGSFDSREIRHEITPLKSMFNRCQIALSTLASAAILHYFSTDPVRLPTLALVPAALAATVANYSVNVALVALAMRLLYSVSIREVLGQLRVGALSEFFLSYLGLGSVGIIIAELSQVHRVGPLAVGAFVLPLVFARQMFFRNMDLEKAHNELKDRASVLRALSNQMADERKDERDQIAAYLHDDTAQMLYRLSLQIEMAKRRLIKGEIEIVQRNLEEIDETRKGTDETIRALIRDLHRSPIGRKGLGEAIRSFADDASKGLNTKTIVDVVEVSLPSPIQLLIYQITREAVNNALKHAEAENIWVSLAENESGVELMIKDDGNGFDTSAPPPEGHFGSVMMRQRAQIIGGTFSVDSEPGRGSTIRATFPPVWIEEGSLLESKEPQSPQSSGPRSRTDSPLRSSQETGLTAPPARSEPERTQRDPAPTPVTEAQPEQTPPPTPEPGWHPRPRPGERRRIPA